MNAYAYAQDEDQTEASRSMAIRACNDEADKYAYTTLALHRACGVPNLHAKTAPKFQ